MADTFLYLTLGTNDLARAARFYDAALAPLGLIRRATEDDRVGYGHRRRHPHPALDHAPL